MSLYAPLGSNWLEWHFQRMYNFSEYLSINGYFSTYGFSIWDKCVDCSSSVENLKDKIYLTSNFFQYFPYVLINDFFGSSSLKFFGSLLDKTLIVLTGFLISQLYIKLSKSKKNNFLNFNISLLIFIFFISNPWTYKMFLHSTPMIYFIFLFLLSVYMFLIKKEIVGLICLFISGLFDYQSAAGLFVFYSLLLIFRKYKKNKDLLNQIEKEFNVEKEILLALWGIETNFGKHVGKMHILSSLATLSFDKRRSEFFSKQLIIILKLIDKKIIDHKKLYGSWAGAYGNFQFMPSTIKSYAIDFDENNKIELKESVEDSFASAANYINKIGWIMGEPCFYRIRMNKKINKKYINLSARKLTRKMSISKWKKKGLVNFDGSEIDGDLKAALIQPDGKPDSPAYLVFNNYEKILKWNRSLRFGVSVCTLANMIKI